MNDLRENPYVKELGRQIDELEEQNTRLREALEEIANLKDEAGDCPWWEIARNALMVTK